MKIAVLIACHNRKEKTLSCLEALFQQQGLDQDYSIQVYLLDDGSTDGTGLAVRESFPRVEVINGSGDLYWNRGMHTAWNAASFKKYDFYLWVNDDTFLYDYALSEMISAANATNDQAIICGCTESPFEKGKLTYGGGKVKNKVYVSNYPDGTVSPCDIINGNCVLIPQVVFEKVGNLDWQFRHGIGDNDYSLRGKKLGISSYTAGCFVGSCEKHHSLPKWCLPEVKLIDRFKNLYSPLGNHPYEHFQFEKRHFGLPTALVHYFSSHLRALMPKLWRYWQ